MKIKYLLLLVLIFSFAVNAYWISKELKYKADRKDYLNYVSALNKKLNNPNTEHLVLNSYFENGTIDSNNIVFIGDSHTYFYKLEEFFPQSNVINRGLPGDISSNLMLRIQKVCKTQPRKVFICIGINDILQQAKPEDVIKNIAQSVSVLRKNCPKTEIYIQSLLPTAWYATGSHPSDYGVREVNEQLNELSQKGEFKFIDIHSELVNEKGELKFEYDCGDKLHLSYKAYKKWSEIIRPFVEK